MPTDPGPGVSAGLPVAAGTGVLVAVDADTPAAVLAEAADLAERLAAPLTVVHVDPSRGSFGTRPDGTPLVLPLDPDLPGDVHRPVLDAVHAQVAAQLGERAVTWSLRTTVGDPATGIIAVADAAGAGVIVVGTRGHGLRRSLHRLVSGSVPARLARQQSRPVLVVPAARTDPTDAGAG